MIQVAKDRIVNGPLTQGLYRNKKNGLFYNIHCFSIDSETLTPRVEYTDSQGIRWSRPYELFVEKFERMG